MFFLISVFTERTKCDQMLNAVNTAGEKLIGQKSLVPQ